MLAGDIAVRFAEERDTEWCMLTAGMVSREFMKSKVGLGEIIVAEAGGELSGILQLDYLWSGHTYKIPFISQLIVVDKHRRRGVGRHILTFLEEYLRGEEFGFLLSSSQLDELPPQEWHRHMGFEEYGSPTQVSVPFF